MLLNLVLTTFSWGMNATEFLQDDEVSRFDYIRGASDQIWLHNNLVGEKRYICFPEGNTYYQTLKIVEKYISDHPEKMHEQVSVLTYNALVSAFPCN